MDKKTAVYICTGCGIGDALDIEELKEEGTEDFKIDVSKDHPCLCSAEGAELIKKDIADEGINTVIIGACSYRVNYDVFNFGLNVVVERVNLREQVAWVMPPKRKIPRNWRKTICVWDVPKPKIPNRRNPSKRKRNTQRMCWWWAVVWPV